MNNIEFSLLLAGIPLINLVLARILSRKVGRLEKFKHHFISCYGDMIFILFNIIFIYAILINDTFVFPILFIAIISNIFFHVHWMKTERPSDGFSYMFYKNNSFNSAGILHLFFSSFQTFLILLFLVSKPLSLGVYFIGSFLLLVFSISALIFSNKMHNSKIPLSDKVIFFGLIIVLIIKIFLIY